MSCYVEHVRISAHGGCFRSWGYCYLVFRNRISDTLFVDYDCMHLHFSDAKGSGLARIKLAITSCCHSVVRVLATSRRRLIYKTHWSGANIGSMCTILSSWCLYCTSPLRICVLALVCNVEIFRCRLKRSHCGSVLT